LGKIRGLELLNFYCRVNILGVMKSNRVGWTGDVTQVSEVGNAYKIYKGQYDWEKCK